MYHTELHGLAPSDVLVFALVALFLCILAGLVLWLATRGRRR